MSTEGMDTRELDDLVKNMFRTAQDVYPDEAKSFLKKEGNKGRRLLRAKTNGDFQIRVYNKAPHAHLIEHGHVLWVNGTKTEKFVPGKHPAADTTKQLKREFPRDVETFVDEMLSKGFEL